MQLSVLSTVTMEMRMSTRAMGAESEAPANMEQEDHIYDNLQHSGPIPNTPLFLRIVHIVLTVVIFILGAIVVWHIADTSAVAGASVNTTRWDTVQTTTDDDLKNKLQEVIDRTRNLENAVRNLTGQVAEQTVNTDFIKRNFGFTNCQTYRDDGSTMSGVYNIYPDQNSSTSRHSVYCEMATNGGGWTVLLRRKDGSVNFTQNWEAYKNGFGDLFGEFWAGNELMFRLTSMTGKTYRLRVELGSYDNEKRYAEYDVFRVDSEREFYRLHVSGYTGTTGDSLGHHNNIMFTTRDEEHDTMSTHNCAVRHQGGFWYHACYHTDLTGPYGSGLGRWNGIIWGAWLGPEVQMKTAVMMVRPT